MTATASVHAQELSKRLDEIVSPLRKADGPGAAVVVLKDGKVLYQRCAGLADVVGKRAITPTTNFRLASVSKQFTAAAVLKLVDEGKVSLDTKLTDMFPGFPAYGREVTLRHLLTHTSGLPDYEDLMPAGITVPLKDVDVLAILAGQGKTYFAPGSEYRYSNSAYAMLALVVEKYSGERYPDFLRERIFRPLGMDHTVAYEEGISTVAERAYGHSPEKAGGYKRTDQSLTSAVLGDGGIYSSLEDLAKWDEALYAGKVLKPETQRAAFSPTVLTGGRVSDYGFGWRVGTYRGKAFVGHGGDTIGFRTHIERYPAEHLTVITLFNRADAEPHEVVRKIVDVCLSE